MIARITGEVLEREAKALVVDVGGVGYRVIVPADLRERAQVGAAVSLRIHHHISDDAEVLFGFEHQDDLEYFLLLLTVPSVGPRTALNILEVAPPSVLAQALSEADTTLLTKVSGVGRKTAERILVELKEKLPAQPRAGAVAGAVQEEAIEALMGIGYTRAQARQAVQELSVTVATSEEVVREVLKKRA